VPSRGIVARDGVRDAYRGEVTSDHRDAFLIADQLRLRHRSQIAQTIVQFGLNLNVTRKASLAQAFQLALQQSDQTIARMPQQELPC
jgi:hypothetical protein